MIDKSLGDLLIRVQRDIYQSAGLSVQTYSQDIIVQKLEDCFYQLACDPEKRWKRYRTSAQYTLNGTTGRTIVPVKNTFKQYGSIFSVTQSQTSRPLTYLPMHVNPTLITGTYPLHWVADSLDVMKVVPASATGDIVVVGNGGIEFPTALDALVTFDYIALQKYVAWEMTTDDGSNPAQAEKFRQQFETRYKALFKQDMTENIALNERGLMGTPSTWWSDDY